MGEERIEGKIIPGLRYRDARGAIDWLCNTFGFERHLVVDDPDGGIAHAQLTLGRSMIMLGGHRDDAYGRMMRSPVEVGHNTQSLYVVVADADAHLARARAAGAEVVLDIEDKDYGGRSYTCKDLEGHIWSFGTYDPGK